MPRSRSRKTGSAKSSSSKVSTSRARKTTGPRPAKSAAKASPAPRSLVCPECGKKFTRAASLGAHRNRAHGVPGASTRNTTSAVATTRQIPKTRTRKTTATSAAQNRRTSGAVNRDALLRALFPHGIPAKEQVIRDVNAWLDQAERLARLS